MTEERRQPVGTDRQILRNLLRNYKVTYYIPRFFLWCEDLTRSYKRHLLRLPAVRHSIRYQHAWEKTDKPYLLIMHNDVRYYDDLVGAYLANIGQFIGIGKIGQCWNCPAYKSRNCWGGIYDTYHPEYEEIAQLYSTYGNVRNTPFSAVIRPGQAWPLPECRLNEFTALINMDVARQVTMPYGPAYPFGTMDGVDMGTQWFRQISQLGLRATNFEYDTFAKHGWTNEHTSGHQSLFDKTMYDAEEEIARQVLEDEFGVTNG